MSGRDLLLAAGARLFADHGVEGVSLREITRAAGQRNVRALQYHFGDRAGLLHAIIELHAKEVAVELGAGLDRVEAAPSPPDSRELVAVVVDALVARLEAPGGPDFLRIAAQLVDGVGAVPADSSDPFFLLSDGYDAVLRRWAILIEPHMDVRVVEAGLHQRFSALRHAYGELARRAVTHPGQGATALFVAHLTDVMDSNVRSEPSPSTLAILSSGPRRTRRAVN